MPGKIAFRLIPPEEEAVALGLRHVYRDDAGEITRPLRTAEIVVVTGADDMDAASVGEIDPRLEVLDLCDIRPTAEAAVQHLVAHLHRQRGGLPDDLELAAKAALSTRKLPI
jgi:hypothetical protein